MTLRGSRLKRTPSAMYLALQGARPLPRPLTGAEPVCGLDCAKDARQAPRTEPVGDRPQDHPPHVQNWPEPELPSPIMPWASANCQRFTAEPDST